MNFLANHYGTITLIGLLLFKTAANALPAQGQPFHFWEWFREWMRELGQQAPNRGYQVTGGWTLPIKQANTINVGEDKS